MQFQKSANLLTIFITFFCVLKQNKAQDFTYDGEAGPEHWGEQYNTCAGKFQSPINIDFLNVRKISLPPLVITGFDVEPETANLKNNGHTVTVTMDFKELPTISGGPLNESYEFAQFHFHWGDNDTYGSEDLINNQSYPIELHVVFYKSIYNEFNNALQYTDGVTVLAFFYEVSNEANPFYEEFTQLLDDIAQPDTLTKCINPPRIQDLITDDLDDYFTYKGSLTTPPCSEVVTWIDFSKPIPISHSQITRFRHLYSHGGHLLTHNFRPIQPLNGRKIYENVPEHELIPSFPKDDVINDKSDDIDKIDNINDVEQEIDNDVQNEHQINAKARQQDNSSAINKGSFFIIMSLMISIIILNI